MCSLTRIERQRNQRISLAPRVDYAQRPDFRERALREWLVARNTRLGQARSRGVNPGAVTRVGPTDTAVPHRAEGWNLLLPSEWMDPADTEANIAWTKDSFAALSEHFSGGRWRNYLGDEQDDAISAAYGPNYERLVEVKRRHDPDNVFHLNHNIVP